MFGSLPDFALCLSLPLTDFNALLFVINHNCGYNNFHRVWSPSNLRTLRVVLGNTIMNCQVIFHQTKEHALQRLGITTGRKILSLEEGFDRELELVI